MTTATDFKTIALADIRPDENQPRKIYDETAMQELAASVKEKGILQPILIRPIGSSEAYVKKDPAAPMGIEIRRAAGYKGPEFLLVCGERRYRASKEAGLEEIPAVIRNLTDEEALELQIIENLQRKDVHPMEEAVAFKSLLENKTRPLTMEEIAAKVGKSLYFIKQRLKLNSLNEDWQKVFYLNRLTSFGALLVAQLSSEVQQQLFKDKIAYRKGWEKDPDFRFDLSAWDIERRQMKLNSAPFDTKDETLNPKMGACTNCPFNSAVACLFPEDAKDPRCNNPGCYNIKVDVSFERRLAEFKDDPGVVFVDNDTYRYGDADPVVKKLTKQGNKVYLYHKNEYQRVSTHGKEWKKDLEAGKILKAFVVAGTEKGGFIYIIFSKSKASSSKPGQSGKITAADCDKEIQRLKDNEKRKKELDAIKVHKDILSAVQDNEAFKKTGLPFQPVDRTLMLFLLLNEVSGVNGYGSTSVNKLVGIPDKPYGGEKYHFDYFDKLAKLTDDQLALIIRATIYRKYGSPESMQALSANHTPMYYIAEYLNADIPGIKAAQDEVAKVRQARVEKRIEQQKELKKSLAEKPAAKKKGAKS